MSFALVTAAVLFLRLVEAERLGVDGKTYCNKQGIIKSVDLCTRGDNLI